MIVPIVLTIAIIAFASYMKSLPIWIFAAMILGGLVSHTWPTLANYFMVPGTIFLRLVKVVIAPLLFGTLVSGIAGHSDLRKVGRVGVKAFIYFEVVSTIALLIGFAAIRVTHAGYGVHLPSVIGGDGGEFKPHSWSEILIGMFPENISRAISDGQTLQIVVFCLLFGAAVALVGEPHRGNMVRFASSVSEIMFKFTQIIMYAAPVGVFGTIGLLFERRKASCRQARFGRFWMPLRALCLRAFASATFHTASVWGLTNSRGYSGSR